jgi:hypothetical protein
MSSLTLKPTGKVHMYQGVYVCANMYIGHIHIPQFLVEGLIPQAGCDRIYIYPPHYVLSIFPSLQP